jgi:hypothetical protein
MLNENPLPIDLECGDKPLDVFQHVRAVADRFVAHANFNQVVLTEDFVGPRQKFPSIIAELRKKAGA